MKNFIKITSILSLAMFTVLSSCKKKEDTTPEQSVNINITAPVEGAAYDYGATVNISATISSVVEMHGYKWELINKSDNSILAQGESGEVHSESYTVSGTYVNTISATTQVELKITVEATHESEVNKSVNITLNGQSQSQAGIVKLSFANKIGGNNVVYDTQWYLNANNDSFNISLLKYYISNVKLNSGGGTYTETESYHLLDHSTASSMNFDLSNVPSGTYNSVTFMIGVDSLRNVSGAQTGALDPNKDMFWSWNTGYIMFKLEGMSPQAGMGGMLAFHVGGFSGANSSLRTVTLTFPQPLVVNADNKQVNINADIAKLFAAPNVIDFSVTSMVHMPGADAKKLADNYATMFSVTSVQ